MINQIKILALLIVSLTTAFSNAQNSIKSTQYITQYGDAMGYTDNETPTMTTEFLYGQNNRIERKIQNGRNEDESWNLVNYLRYDYNEAGNISMTNSLQYGLYDQNNYDFKAANDTVEYKYNEAGQLVQTVDKAAKTIHEYEYDVQSNIIKDSRTRNGKVDLVITYSDFTLGGPQTILAEATSSYNAYTGKITYDAMGNKTSEKHLTVANEPVQNYAEYWTYNSEGTLTCYEKKAFSNGTEMNGTKVEYEQIDENTVCSHTYTWSTDHWAFKQGSKKITTYSNFDASLYAPTGLTATVNSEKSQVALSFTASPQAGASYNIYCDGLLVGNTEATEFLVENVKNGNHEFFVQTCIDGKNYNVSNVVKVNVNREYPHASNFRATTASLTTDGNYMVTLAWNNPTITEDLGYINTNIIKVGKYTTAPLLDYGCEITDPEQNNCRVSFGIDKELTLYVQTRYSGGVVSSDTIVVDVTKILGHVANNNHKLRVVETYGDAMGETNGLSKKVVTYYGIDNRIEREARYATDLENPSTMTIYEYTSYIYDDANMLAKSYVNPYGRYDFGDMGFNAAQDTTYYEHNIEGQLTKEYSNAGYTTYEYDSNGYLVKKSIVELENNSNEQVLEYSDFVGRDMPQTTISTGTRSSSQFKLQTTYDSNGNKLTEKKYSWSNSNQNYSPSQYEILEYDAEGNLSIDSVYTVKVSDGVEKLVPKSYTTYVPEEGNANRVVVVKKVWDNILSKWGNPKTYDIYEYTEIDADKYAPTLSVEYVEGKANTALLSVSVPVALENAMTALNVYRSGIEIAHCINYFDADHYTTDEYGYNGKWTFEDSATNGTYDYFVEYAHLDATMQNEASVHNISNIVRHTYSIDLPCATGLKVVGASYNVVSNETDEGTILEVQAVAMLQWNAPEDAESYGVKQYRVMVEGMNVGENDEEENPLATTYSLDMRGRKEVKVYIQSVYEFGRSDSESIIITEDFLKQFAAGIKEVESGKRKVESYDYHISGQKVNGNFKGIVIKNGKKYLRK